MYDEELFLERYNSKSWDIWSELDEVLLLWKGAYREYWGIDRRGPPEGLTETQWKGAKTSDKLATAFLKWGLALSLFPSSAGAPEEPIPTTKLKEFRTALREHAKLSLVRDRVGLEVAADVVEQLTGSTHRALRLLGIVQGRQLSERASMYVARAARLYVWGFEPEAAVMCRSGLEAALVCRLESLLDLDSATPSLDNLLRLAGENDILEGSEASPRSRKGWRARSGTPLWRAERLKWRGNNIVHNWPVLDAEDDEIIDAFTTLRELVTVLDELFPSKPF